MQESQRQQLKSVQQRRSGKLGQALHNVLGKTPRKPPCYDLELLQTRNAMLAMKIYRSAGQACMSLCHWVAWIERSEVPSVDIPAALPPPDAVPPPVLDDETTATDDHGFDGSNIDGLDPNFNDLEALNSDCDDDEDEMTFDESVANNDPDAPDEIPVGANDATIEDPVGATVLQDEPTSVADDGETEWPVLNQDEMVGFVKNEAALARMRRSGWYLAPDEFPPDQHYPGLYNGVTGPTDELKALADSPLDLFLYFMPRTLWETIAQQSTLYHEQHLVERVERMFEKQRVAGRKTREEFMEQEARHGDIKPHEIVVLLGLLIARMINPQRRHFYDHWSTTSVGAIPAGTFGKFMKRNRFTYILSNLHFTDNADERAGQDRAWKIRSVVDTLQLTFKAGFIAPAVIAFDEAMIPLQNQHNPTRQYVANKPHKWGTKLFMTCCAQTSYCLRIEVYCGKAQHRHEIGNVPESVQSVDHNTGPAAVMRNLDAVLPPASDGVYHLNSN
ncbi:hypothetical protein L915_19599 [Phytophthora nicotianae]|uniref:PiggyBac transposable element-derived protein domain-containing protein n=1 Tax=Phytophthora nicotianae TaxID=4792 RepID=W2FU87_PHYNI|nr:hypothetical protein L915_19599 [Phytophthora nicotianae]